MSGKDLSSHLKPEGALSETIAEHNRQVDEMDLFNGDVPGVGDDVFVEGGADVGAEDDNCAGGACKI
ncbi:hypothetical protein pEaSNUABM10_00250 [Erwinia phage pEa_SNUABM_10]|nr:hypothetical protein pEaSNUABM10_00250 [Erwinia phage pEa_SNUABM_10]QVW56385.1 hypothetical protein pEaSNUABM6_00249 [Erwinia phage pEa_SNUABM_6]